MDIIDRIGKALGVDEPKTKAEKEIEIVQQKNHEAVPLDIDDEEYLKRLNDRHAQLERIDKEVEMLEAQTAEYRRRIDEIGAVAVMSEKQDKLIKLHEQKAVLKHIYQEKMTALGNKPIEPLTTFPVNPKNEEITDVKKEQIQVETIPDPILLRVYNAKTVLEPALITWFVSNSITWIAEAGLSEEWKKTKFNALDLRAPDYDKVKSLFKEFRSSELKHPSGLTCLAVYGSKQKLAGYTNGMEVVMR